MGFINYVVAPSIGAAFIAVLWWNLEASSFKLGAIWGVIGLIVLAKTTKFFTVKPPESHFDEVDAPIV